jgi:hypothetical protein
MSRTGCEYKVTLVSWDCVNIPPLRELKTGFVETIDTDTLCKAWDEFTHCFDVVRVTPGGRH